jgi:hypothetical protein
MRFQPSTHSLGAFGHLGEVDRDTTLSARKKFLKEAGFATSTPYEYLSYNNNPVSLMSRIGSRVGGIKLAGDIYYSWEKTVYTAATSAKLSEFTDRFMYPYYTGSKSAKDALKAVRSYIKSDGTKSRLEMRDKYVNILTELIAELEDGSSSSSSSSSSPSLDSKLLNGTWNDGAYTYKIDSAGNVKVKTTTYDKKHASYAAVVAQLNADFASGKLTKGALAVASSAPAVYTPPAEIAPPPPKGITEQPWFIPAAGATVLVVVGGLAWWAFRTPSAPQQ